VISLDDPESEVQKPAVSASSTTKSFKHLNDSQWSTFCGRKLQYFETKWTKKLESYV
jgi:hypothetical protein